MACSLKGVEFSLLQLALLNVEVWVVRFYLLTGNVVMEGIAWRFGFVCQLHVLLIDMLRLYFGIAFFRTCWVLSF